MGRRRRRQEARAAEHHRAPAVAHPLRGRAHRAVQTAAPHAGEQGLHARADRVADVRAEGVLRRGIGLDVKRWLLGSRPWFLTVAAVLVLHGSTLAFWRGSFEWSRFALALVGLVMLHGSVNLLNDWHDYSKTGIDRVVRRTPFSGGSGQLTAGNLSAAEALAAGLIALAVGSTMGLLLVADLFRERAGGGWPLLAIGATGVLVIVLYTPVALKIGLGELLAGLGLGMLPVLGVYYAHTLRLDAAAWWSSVPALLLTLNLLYLNEFPDWAADKVGKRRHLVILLGPRRASRLYAVVEAAAFAGIVGGVAAGALTPWSLLGLGGIVPAAVAVRGALAHYDKFEELFPALGANVAAVLATNMLLALGYLIAGVLARG
ncbi:MAG: prenyltransferase [Actinobacteria bacterium]|nr:MAG: prenyltransferase [Actinomycetota bacterium]